MAIIREGDVFTQIVRFDVSAEKQLELIAAVVREIERWVCRRPGFISSTLHASDDGRCVVNYAQWESEAAFRRFIADPETGALQAAIRAVDASLKPDAVHCRVVRSVNFFV